MATEKKTTTKKPTGMSVKRNKGKFTCTWKIGDKNYGDGQQCYYRTNRMKDGEWNKLSCGNTTTAKSVSLTLSNYYPSGKELEIVRFKVRGNRDTYTTGSGDKEIKYKPQWSDFTYDSFDVKAPSAPSVGVTPSDEYANRCRFSWHAADSDTSARPFTRVQWQAVLLKNSNIKDGPKAFKAKHVAGSYLSGTSTTASSGQTITEDSGKVEQIDNVYTRWFRVRAQGPAGDSKWVYTSHSYALPNRAKNVSASIKKQDNGYKIGATWTTTSSKKRPIDYIELQYAIATPDANVTFPSGASWTDVIQLKYKDGSDRFSFVMDEGIGADEALWIRVNTIHDQRKNPGNPTLVTVGALTAPTLTSVVTDDNTFKATVTATNNSAVSDSRLAVYYQDSRKPENLIIIGVMAHSDSSIVVQAPDWSGANTKAFGVMAFVGKYTQQTRADGVKVYSLSAYENKKLMTSTKVWSGQVPTAPTNVTLNTTNAFGTIRVTWDWTWAAATGAELSWADHEDAWESTDEPSTYTISSMHASAWNISGLDVGITWYVRVRLIDESGDEPIPGPWSDIANISLASAPNIPSLSLSAAVIPAAGTVTASWAYTTTDGTPQASAELCQVADVTQPSADYVVTEDTAPLLGVKYYYIRSGSGTALDPYVYKVYDCIDYTATSDATVDAGKNYYKRTGSGTAASPYVYTLVESPTGNPSSQGWYETDGTSSANPHTLGLYELNYRIIATTETAQHIDLNAAEVGWETNEEYNLCVRVTSASGQTSDGWSDPATIIIAEPLTCTISQTSLTAVTVSTDDVDATTESVTSLTALPFTVTVTGAGNTGTTSVIVERAEACYLERPDETNFTGHAGETILIASQVGEDQMSFGLVDLIGSFDDGAKYRLIATTSDGIGQSAQATLDFEVHWAHQALIPTANIAINNNNLVTFITPIAPAGAIGTDTCDIYRLSADKPELIFQGAEFGTMYVDPYPALGEMGGHRIVFRTAEGDYITQDNTLAWTDYRSADGDIIETMYNVIDFNGDQVRAMYDIELSSGWNKDFQETKYLGGHIQGDWNPAVLRTGGVSGDYVTIEDQDMIQTMRRLADWSGICHVRTRDGSSYAADVQVSESRDMGKDVIRSEFSLSITRVDTEGFDGMSYADWISGDESE